MKFCEFESQCVVQSRSFSRVNCFATIFFMHEILILIILLIKNNHLLRSIIFSEINQIKVFLTINFWIRTNCLKTHRKLNNCTIKHKIKYDNWITSICVTHPHTTGTVLTNWKNWICDKSTEKNVSIFVILSVIAYPYVQIDWM